MPAVLDQKTDSTQHTDESSAHSSALVASTVTEDSSHAKAGSFGAKSVPSHPKIRIFFPALTSLRFFAAMTVVIAHIELNKGRCGLGSPLLSDSILAIFAKGGIHLLFVLSSFLLTYLLLTEAKAIQTVRIKDFYVRRALRIWPLYFVIVAVSFVLVPCTYTFWLHPGEAAAVVQSQKGYLGCMLMFLCMLPQLALIEFPRIVCGSHLWSIGIEEQYYLCWPLLVKALNKRPFLMCSIFLVGLVCFRAACIATLSVLDANHTPKLVLSILQCAVWTSHELMCMVIGAVAAVLLFTRKKLISTLLHNALARFCVIATIILCLVEIVPINQWQLGILSAFLVLTLTDPKIRLMSHRSLVYLGTISYGMYMFHPLLINLLLKPCAGLSSQALNAVLYLTVLPVSVVAGAVSYKYLEEPFLRLKRKFTTVESV